MNIIPVTPKRLDSAARVLARAFFDDPMIRWCVGGDVTDRPALEELDTACFRIVNVANTEGGWMWETEDGAGTVVWLPPEATSTFQEDDVAMRPAIARIVDDPERYNVFWDWLNAFIPDEPTWFLDQIGVEPDRQGEGIGRALIEHGLEMSRAAGQPAYLETGARRNVAYYESFGFRVVHEGDAPDGGPHIWFMQLEAPTGSSGTHVWH